MKRNDLRQQLRQQRRQQLRQHLLAAIGFTVWIASSALSAPALAAPKYYRSSTSDYLMSYDISQSVSDAPLDWNAYNRDFDRWYAKWGKVKDGKASSIKSAVTSSPACVLVNGDGDHVKVFRLNYKNPGRGDKVAVRGLLVTTFSDNNKGNADGNRKSAQRNIAFYCGSPGNAKGILTPN